MEHPRRRMDGGRLSFAVLLSVLGVGLLGAGIAWACTPSDYGWDAPSAPASETPVGAAGAGQPSAPTTSSPGVAGAQSPSVTPVPAPVPAPALAPVPVRAPASAPVPAPASAPVPVPAPVENQAAQRAQPSPGTQPVQRRRSATRPVQQSSDTTSQRRTVDTTGSSGTEEVVGEFEDEFDGASSGRAAAPSGTPQARGGSGANADEGSANKGGARAAQRSTVQSTTGDLWSAFEADRSSSLAASGGESPAAETGPGTGFGVGLAMLGIGAVALLAGLALGGARRRRSLASAHR